jgi:adenosylcobinamide-GDP ribazoletransferase
MRILSDFFLSAWSFYFRWPRCRLQIFYPSALFLGPFLQALVFLLSALVFQGLFPSEKSLPLFLGMISLAALTGFFHEDGFADSADSLGVSKFDRSEAVLARIAHAFKDPRLGSFGVCALCLLWIFRFFLSTRIESLALLCACYLVSRVSALFAGVLASRTTQIAVNARSSHLMKDISIVAASLSLLVCFLMAERLLHLENFEVYNLVNFFQMNAASLGNIAVLLLPFAAVNLFVFGMVKRTEGLNGDILGAGACLGEILVGLILLRYFS